MMSAVVEIQLLHDVGSMRFDRVDAEIEILATSLLDFPFRQQLQSFLLSFGQQVIAVLQTALLQLAHVVPYQDSCDGGTEEGLALGSSFDRAHQVKILAIFSK
jgi:hypothetical protein